VKDEIYRVAERHLLKGVALHVFVVSNTPINIPRDPMIERVVVSGDMDAADNWIAERAGKHDIVITADIPLAARTVKSGAATIAPNGKPFSESSIGMTLATRNLMTDLRSAGEVTRGPRPFSPRDRSEFLSALDRAIRAMTMRRQKFEIALIYVPVKRRETLDQAKVDALAESILAEGLKTPIQVREDGKRFVLMEGLHRLEAAKALGETTIYGYLVQAQKF
jgi:uncharacterized protein